MRSFSSPQARFDPIPLDLDLNALVEKTPTFDYVMRIPSDQLNRFGIAELEKLVMLHVIVGGKPLVIEGWNNSLPPWLFSRSWLEENMGKKQETVRDIGNSYDLPMTMGHYLRAMGKLTNQWTTANYRDPERQRLYLKDIDCPEPWHQHLQGIIPEALFYLNDSVGEKGGPASTHERNVYNQLVLGKGVGPAGDLMSNLPPEMRAENMMCYIGYEGTYTPAHREMCASLGQNIMVEASGTKDGEKPGSSLWFMTESKDREVVSEYFLSMLGHDIEVESHFAQVNAWKKAPFPVYIVEQKVGDFILVPPLAPHQVWNRGTRTMKVAWNRTTVETLELAMDEALPRARMVCRDEQYKNKAIIYYSLRRYYDLLKRVEQAEQSAWDNTEKDLIRNSIQVKQLKRDFKRLFTLFTGILVSEMFSKDLPKEKYVEFVPFDSNVTCSYCRCNIFNRFLTCKTCISEDEKTGEEDAYDVCMECYAMGRSCACMSKLKWVEQWRWLELSGRYEDWRTMAIRNDGFVNKHSPQTLDIARSSYGKKTVAQICQEELKKRPWIDITKPCGAELSLEDSDAEEKDRDKRQKKKKASKRKARNQKNSCRACHICQHRDWNWKLANCSTCPNVYCYGTLWRAFDLKPQTVMENPNWRCPKCLQICSCSKCCRRPSQNPYRPKGTLLGHDTKRIADPRSVESLVDFSRPNLTWLRSEGDNDPQTSLRMQKLMKKAKSDKARVATVEQEAFSDVERYSPENNPMEDLLTDELTIDPQLNDHISSRFDPTNKLDKTHLGDDSTATLSHLSEDDEQMALNSDVDHLLHTTETEDHTNNNYHNGYHPNYVAPEATIFVPETTYPGSAGLIRDRLMGMAYYQQANDADKILFDDPDVDSGNGFGRGYVYPRLVDMPDMISESKKRDEDSISYSNDSKAPGMQMAGLQSKKKQKLSHPNISGPHLKSREKVDGSSVSIDIRPKRKSKRSSCIAEESLESQLQPNENSRLPNMNNLKSGHQNQPAEIGDNISRSPFPYGAVQNLDKHQDLSHDYNIFLAIQAMHNLTHPPEIPTSEPETKSPKVVEKRGLNRPRKTPVQSMGRVPENAFEEISKKTTQRTPASASEAIPENATENTSEKDAEPDLGQGMATPVLKRGRGRSRSNFAQNNPKEHLPLRPSDSGRIIEGRLSSGRLSRGQPGGPSGDSSYFNTGVASNTRILVQDKMYQQPTTNSGSSNTEDKNVTTSSEGQHPVSSTPASMLQTDTNLSVREDYRIPKEQILRMVQAELEEEENARRRSVKVIPAVASKPKPPSATTVSLRTKISTNGVTPTPKSPSMKLFSKADRPRTNNKAFNNVGENSIKTHSPIQPVIPSSASNIRSTKPAVIIPQTRLYNDSDGPLTDVVSSSDDENNSSIPAVRLVSKKPRVEIFSAHNGQRTTRLSDLSK